MRLPGTGAATLGTMATLKSIAGDRTVSPSVAVLLAITGSRPPPLPLLLIVAVLTRRPEAPSATTPVAWNTTLAPTSRLTDSLKLPTPEALHAPPGLGVQVQVTVENRSGNGSLTMAPVTLLGPRLLAVMV